MLNSKSGKKTIFDYLFILIILDICLFPYIRQIKVLTSMLIVAVFFLINFKKLSLINSKVFISFIISVILIIVSVCAGVMIYPNTVDAAFSASKISILSYSLSYSAIFIFTYLYLLYFSSLSTQNIAIAYNWIKIVYFIMFGFSVLFLISPPFFYQIRPFWTMSTGPTSLSIGYRYTFSFSDPNNTAAIATTIMILILENKKEKIFSKVIAFFANVVILIASMSSQGIIAFILYFLLKIILFIFQSKQILVSGKTVLALLFAIVMLFVLWQLFQDQSVIGRAVIRVTNNDNSFISRLKLWYEFLSENGVIAYLLIGRGNANVVNGIAKITHNGHLYLLYSYGTIVYVLFLDSFFFKAKNSSWKQMFFLLPLFICFTVNIGLIDARFSFMMAAIISIGKRMIIAKNQFAQN